MIPDFWRIAARPYRPSTRAQGAALILQHAVGQCLIGRSYGNATHGFHAACRDGDAPAACAQGQHLLDLGRGWQGDVHAAAFAGVLVMCSVPPSSRTMSATASMPMPRPATSVSWLAVPAGLQNQRGGAGMVYRLVGADQPHLDGLFANRFGVEPCAIVKQAEHLLQPGRVQADEDLAGFRLLGGLALCRRFNAMSHAVAQQVLKGWRERLCTLRSMTVSAPCQYSCTDLPQSCAACCTQAVRRS